MVRFPLTAAQIEAGRRLGVTLREARAGRDPAQIARTACISPETLRKLESGRMPSPGFGTIVALCGALQLPIEEAAQIWLSATDEQLAGQLS